MDNVISQIQRTNRTLEYFTKIAEHANEGIAVADRDGAIRFVNDAWVMMHGYDNRNELIGKKISSFHSEEQMRTDVIGFIEETIRRGRLEGPIEHMRKDRTSFATHTKMTAIKGKQGNVVGLIVFVTDLSSSKRTEKLIKQQLAKLTTVNKHLQGQINKYRKMENEWQQCREHFEQRAVKLRASNDQLQNQVVQQMQVENELQEYCNRLEQQSNELAAAVNKVVQFATSGNQVHR